MDGHTFLSWNIPNFLTVVLMGALGFALLKASKSWAASRNGS
jgi:hypothetical protein